MTTGASGRTRSGPAVYVRAGQHRKQRCRPLPPYKSQRDESFRAVLLKGFREPIGYHELLWGQQLYGVKSASVTASTDRLRPTPTTTTIPARTLPTNRPTGKAERHHGAVTYWNADKGPSEQSSVPAQQRVGLHQEARPAGARQCPG